MPSLDAGTVLLQWATGGLFFCWITTRRREVGLGYGWMLRLVYGALAAAAAAVGILFSPVPVRDAAAIGVVIVVVVVQLVSISRRSAGVAGPRADAARRHARVAAMAGEGGVDASSDAGPEFDPRLDLVAPIIGAVGLFAAALDGGGNTAVVLLRTFAGAAFLGAVSDAMLLGHWYLTQPGLSRAPLNDLVRWVGWVWPVEVVALLLPVGMFSVLNGTIDDGYSGTLAWFWVACAGGTIVLVFVTRAALKERYYSAVMAATGLLYLAILTAFGTDLVARAILAGA